MGPFRSALRAPFVFPDFGRRKRFENSVDVGENFLPQFENVPADMNNVQWTRTVDFADKVFHHPSFLLRYGCAYSIITQNISIVNKSRIKEPSNGINLHYCSPYGIVLLAHQGPFFLLGLPDIARGDTS